MELVTRSKMCMALASVALVWAMLSAGQCYDSCEITTVLSALPGEEPGEYFYDRSPGHNDFPRCFGMDPNAQTLYVPEVHGSSHEIRIHKFDKDGTLLEMFKPEGKGGLVSDIAIDAQKDIYMTLWKPKTGKYICRYNGAGKLLCSFGPKGPITKQDLEAEKRGRQAHLRNPVADKYFVGSSRLFLLPYKQVLLVRGYHEEAPETFTFDARTGEVLQQVKSNRNLPVDIAAKKVIWRQRLEELNKAAVEQGRQWNCGYSLVGPDGHFYYMMVTRERLQIRKVIFHEDAASPEDSGENTQ